jgi:branched-chain amino acid transport system ATP-binding protein
VNSPNSSRPALEVVGLNAFYGKSQVVFDVDLELERGETMSILGRNGAGKTTVLMALAGAVNAHAQRIRIDGREISRLPSFRRVRAGLALVPSGSRSFPNLTVEENMEIAIAGTRKSKRPRWAIADVYDAFPALGELKHKNAGTLSGGERQMLAVGRALVAGPQILMLDEPSEGLAPLILRQITERIRSMNEEGISVLLAEQSHRFALATADRALFVEKGRMVWAGTAAVAARPEIFGRYLAV